MLREYQNRAVDATINSLRKGNNPVCAVATGGGKSLIIAALVDRFRSRQGKSIVVTRSRTLVTQNLNALRRYSHDEGVGVFSAGLNSAQVGEFATYCTIQTIYRHLEKFPRDISAILVDEAQDVAHKVSDAKMYNALMEAFPEARKIGFTATPYRLDKGVIYGGDGAHFDDLAIEITVKELVDSGFLTPLIGVSAADKLDLNGIHRTNGDFDTKEVDERITEKWLASVIDKVKNLAEDRKAILLFAPTVRVAKLAAELATAAGIPAEYVHGGDDERENRLARWEAGEFRLMANCQILTTGYDRPNIDCIVDCAPTESLGKHIQKLGRGTRKAEGKTNCLVIDVSGNLERLGGICAGIEEVYEQKATGEVIRGDAKPKPPKRKINSVKELTDLDPMMASPRGVRVKVKGMTYLVIKSGSQPGKRLVMASYNCELGSGATVSASDFLMGEYTGFAFEKTKKWFNRRGVTDFPYRADTMQQFCYSLPEPREVTIRKNGKYINVVEEYF